MKVSAKKIKTPVGYFPAPMSPAFKGQLEKCKTNEDLFNLVEEKGFINPDAFNEVDSRGLYQEYQQWKRNPETIKS